MFEKEAEEIAKDIYIHHFDDDVNYPDVLKAITVGVQKGAEFGYNKANEWHYPSKGEYPKEDCEVIILHENGKKTIQKWKNRNWANAIVIPVIAWKEIVPPRTRGDKNDRQRRTDCVQTMV